MKSKIFSFINVFGLAIGLTCCMLISLYLYNELNYDAYHRHKEQLYQLGTIFVKQGGEERMANTPGPMAATMQQEFPEIEKSTRLLKTFADDKTLLQFTPTSADRLEERAVDRFIKLMQAIRSVNNAMEARIYR